MADNKERDWNLKMSTEAIHAGEMHDPSGAHIDPVHMTSTYVFEDVDAIGSWARGENEAHVYSRVGNPNRKALSTKLAALEGFGLDSPVSAEIFASGMGAVTASIMGFAGSGDHGNAVAFRHRDLPMARHSDRGVSQCAAIVSRKIQLH